MAEASTPKINRLVAYAVALLGISSAIYVVVGSLANFGGVNDLPEFYVAASMTLNGHAADIYVNQALFDKEHSLFPNLARGVAIYIPPPAVLLLLPLALVPVAAAPIFWVTLLAGCLIGAIVVLVRWLRLKRGETLWLVGILFLSGPAVESVRIGQLAPIMLLALVSFAALSEKQPLSSALLLNVLIFKPQQLWPVLVFMSGSVRKHLIIPSVLVLAAFTLLSLLVLGTGGLLHYMQSITSSGSVQYMQPSLTPTVRGQLMRIRELPTSVANLCAVAGLVLATIIIAALGIKNRAGANWLALCLTAVMPIGLLTSLHCHDYDLLLLVPGLVLLTRTILWTNMRVMTKCLVMIGLAAFLMPFYQDIHYQYLLKGGVWNPHFFLLLLYAAYVMTKAWTKPEQFASAEV